MLHTELLLIGADTRLRVSLRDDGKVWDGGSAPRGWWSGDAVCLENLLIIETTSDKRRCQPGAAQNRASRPSRKVISSLGVSHTRFQGFLSHAARMRLLGCTRVSTAAQNSHLQRDA
jgi:hypothetical protein